jgi:hypothetical protein
MFRRRIRFIAAATCFALAAALVAVPVSAQEQAAARAKTVAPFLEDDAFAVVRVDLAKLDLKAGLAALERDLTGELKKEISAPLKNLDESRAAIVAAGGKDAYVVFSLADLPGGPFAVFTATPKADRDALANVIRSGLRFRPDDDMICEPLKDHSGIVYAGNKAALARLLKHRSDPAARPELAKAFETAGQSAVQALLIPSKDHRRVVNETMPRLPVELGGGPSKPLSDGLRFAALSIDVSPKVAARLVIQADAAASARMQQELILKTYKLLGEHATLGKMLPGLKDLLRLLEPRVAEDRVVIEVTEDKGGIAALLAVVKPLVRETRADAERRLVVNNLKQIGLAMHNYHDVHKSFPAAANYDAAGKPLLSWRVHILPYLEQEALYKQFRLDEPWDSEHNKKLIAKMPEVYRSTSGKLAAEGMTTLLAPLGETTVFSGAKGVPVSEILDGTVNTIFILHADDALAVTWTKPDDWKFDPKDPLKKELLGKRDRIATLFCDGSVRLLPSTIDAVTFGRVIMRNDGNPVELP